MTDEDDAMYDLMVDLANAIPDCPSMRLYRVNIIRLMAGLEPLNELPEEDTDGE